MQTDFLDNEIVRLTNSVKLVFIKSILTVLCLLIAIGFSLGNYSLGKFFIDLGLGCFALSAIVYYFTSIRLTIYHLNNDMINLIINITDTVEDKKEVLPIVESYFKHLVILNNYRNPNKFSIKHWLINHLLGIDSLIFKKIECAINNRCLSSFVISVPPNLWTPSEVWTKGYIKVFTKEKVGTYKLNSKDIDPMDLNNNKLKLKLFSDYEWIALFFQLLSYETYICRTKESIDGNISNKVIMVGFNGN